MFKKSILSIIPTVFLFNCAPTVEKEPINKYATEIHVQDDTTLSQYDQDQCSNQYSLSSETQKDITLLIAKANAANEAGDELEAKKLLQAASDLSVQGAIDFQSSCEGLKLSESAAPMGAFGAAAMGLQFFLKHCASLAASLGIGVIDMVASHSIAAVQGVCITANIVVLGETNCFPTEEPVGGDDDMGTGSDDDYMQGDDTSALLATIDSLNATIVSLNATIESLEAKIEDLENNNGDVGDYYCYTSDCP